MMPESEINCVNAMTRSNVIFMFNVLRQCVILDIHLTSSSPIMFYFRLAMSAVPYCPGLG